MAEKEIKSCIRMKVIAGNVVPNAKIASSLGPKGIPAPKFCQEASAILSNGENKIANGSEVTIQLKIFTDKTYSIENRGVPTVYLIKRALGIDSCSSEPGKKICAKIPFSKVVEIAKEKMQYLATFSEDAAVKAVLGTLKSMGIAVSYDD